MMEIVSWSFSFNINDKFSRSCNLNDVINSVGVGLMEAIGLMTTGKLPMELQDIHLAVPSLNPGIDSDW